MPRHAVATSATVSPLIATLAATQVIQPTAATVAAAQILPALPGGQALFVPNPSPNPQYLLESRYPYATQSGFLGSQYLIDRLGVKPNQLPPELGDAYFDTRYVDQQVLDATGKTYLSPSYTSDTSQMQALLNGAATEATALNLQVGVDLTQAQVAALTQDIVWYVPREVDGETVLVPQLYLASADQAQILNGTSTISGTNVSLSAQNITNDGSTISATNNLTLVAQQNIVNQGGTITAGGDLTLVAAAGSIENLATLQSWSTPTYSGTGLVQQATISAGGTLTAVAGQDIDSLASSFSAGGSVQLAAAGDVTLGAAALSSSSSWGSSDRQGHDASTTQLGSVVQAGTNATIVAGNDITVTASALDALGNLSLSAGGDITLAAALNSTYHQDSGSSSGFFSSSSWNNVTSTQTVVGDSLTAGGAITVTAGSNLSLAASNLTSTNGAITLAAAGNVTLDPVAAAAEDLHQRTESGFSLTSLSNTTTATNQGVWTTTQTGTSVSGQSVTVQAGQNLTLTDASLVGSKDVSLQAGGNVDIQNALDTISTLNTKSVVTTGLISSGFNVMLGQTSQTLSQASTQQLLAGSTVGSVAGNLTVAANQNVAVTGSSLIAGANLTLTGQNVTINPGFDLLTATDTQTASSAGISVGLGGSLGTAINTLYSDVTSAQTTTDSRLTALKGVQAAYGAAQLAGLGDASQSASSQAQQPDGIQVQVSIGASSSKSVSTIDQSVAQGSSLTAGGNLTIAATAGSVTVTGSNLTAGGNVLLAATENVTLDAAQSTSTTTSTNSSSGWNVGASFGVTDQSAGLGVFANASVSGGQGNGTGIANTNTTVTAGQGLFISAGNNVTLSGAQASGASILLDAGNDLNLTSLQDTNTYKSNQQSVSGGVAVSEGGGSANASFSQSNINSTFASVGQQTGLFAGAGGFQINVGGNTNLTGAVIASSAPAANNILTTGTLTFSNILNQANYSANTIGGSFSSGASGAANAISNVAGALGSLTGPGGNASGTTLSAISAGTVNVLSDATTGANSTAGLSRDTTGANGSIAPIFNLQQIQNNAAVSQAFGQVANNLAGDALSSLKDDQGNQMFPPGSAGAVALHGLVGAVQGELSGGSALAGAAGAASSQALVPVIATYLAGQGIDPASDEYKVLLQAGTQIVGSAIGAAAGAASGSGAQTGALSGGDAATSAFLFNDCAHNSKCVNPTAKTDNPGVPMTDTAIPPDANGNDHMYVPSAVAGQAYNAAVAEVKAPAINLTVGVNGSLVIGGGIEFSGGLSVNPGTLDAGIYGSAGGGFGANLSLGVSLGVSLGDTPTGYYLNQNAGAGPFGLTGSTSVSPSGISFGGGSVSFGIGTPKYGTSTTTGVTASCTILTGCQLPNPPAPSTSPADPTP